MSDGIPFVSYDQTPSCMLRSYFIIAARQLNKEKLYSIIKIGGFALSIAACILIALYIKDELSYDKSIPDSDRIYRVIGVDKSGPKIGKATSWPSPMAKALVSDFPEVEASGRLMPNSLFYGAGSNQIQRADQVENNYEEGFTYADQGLFDIMGRKLIYGNPQHLLDEPNTMVITERKAEKYFPHQNPVGKTMFLNGDKTRPFKITGVVEDFASHSQLQFDWFLSLIKANLFPGEADTWGADNHDTYVKLKPGVKVSTFQKTMRDGLMNKYIIPEMLGEGQQDAKAHANKFDIVLQPVSDVYLNSYDISDSLPRHGDIRFIWMFGGIACFILLIACINFINLATAKSAGRAKEVGLRKVVGSYRSSLIAQFLAESMVYSLLSFTLAIVLAWALLPLFNRITDKSLIFPFNQWSFYPVILGAIVIVGLVAGLYPAFYLSDFKPIKVLKGQVTKGTRNASLRSVLVVFQFTTSIILIIGTLVIYKQMHFILHKNVGFDKDQVMIIQGTNTMSDANVRTFRDALARLPQASSVSISDYIPVDGGKRNGNSFFHFDSPEENPTYGEFWIGDYDYLHTMGMQLLKGRNFQKDMAGDTAAIIINEALSKKLGLGENPVGQQLVHFKGGPPFRIIGVVKDFNFQSFKSDIGPVAIVLGLSPSLVSIKLNTKEMGNLIPQVTSIWKRFEPYQPLRYTFLDDRFKSMYADVHNQVSLFTGFAVLAIVIACLGLFALSAFMAEQRAKEISIRKVLGATVAGLTALMSKDFVKLVLISILIATPLAWWGTHQWLQDFVYQEHISGWLFVAVGFFAVLLALATIAYQSIKVATDRPMKSLKSE
jgi:putative ABC transport system permease protein